MGTKLALYRSEGLTVLSPDTMIPLQIGPEEAVAVPASALVKLALAEVRKLVIRPSIVAACEAYRARKDAQEEEARRAANEAAKAAKK